MKPLSVRLFQTNIHWEDKEKNINTLKQWLENNRHTPSHITILPEMFTTGFTMNAINNAESMQGDTLQQLKDLSAQYKTILCGSIIVKDNKQYYNRFLWIMPDGNIASYDKRHLFSLANEQNTYTAGEKRLIVQVNQWKILVQICYDIRFPVWCRQQNNSEYDVMLVVANWPEVRSYAWRHLLIARAIENQCYVLAVNRVGNDDNGIHYNGCSMIVDPLGQIIEEVIDKEAVIFQTLDYEKLSDIRGRFRFLNDKDNFLII